MTIKAKILSLVAVFTILAIAITGLGLKTMAEYDRIIADYNRASENSFRAERLNRYMSAAALEYRGIYIARSEADALRAANRSDVAADRLTAFLTIWRSALKPGELPEFSAVHDKAMNLAMGGHMVAKIMRDEGQAAANTFGNKPNYIAYREQTQSSIDTMVERIAAEQSRSRLAFEHFKTERQTQFLFMATSGILIILAGSLWLAISAITNPLNRVRQSMIRISEGHYDTAIPAHTGEIGELWRALGILKAHAVEADRLSKEKLKQEQALRELVLD